jgi:hypothetical protein
MAKKIEPVKAPETGADRGMPVSGQSGGSVVGIAATVAVVAVVTVARLVAKLWDGLTRDGTLAAFMRQGADEVGAALKAFPDAIQTQESGTVWNPTQGEIAASRSRGKHSGNYISFSNNTQPWPSQIARENNQRPGSDKGRDHGHDAGQSM